MMIGLEHLSEDERRRRRDDLDVCVRSRVEGDPELEGLQQRYLGRLWETICNSTSDWSERLVLVDANLCVVVSLGEMMISKGVFGQKHIESAASLLSEFMVFDRTDHPAHRASRARLLKDRLADVSLGAGEQRALRLLEMRIDLELQILKGAC